MRKLYVPLHCIRLPIQEIGLKTLKLILRRNFPRVFIIADVSTLIIRVDSLGGHNLLVDCVFLSFINNLEEFSVREIHSKKSLDSFDFTSSPNNSYNDLVKQFHNLLKRNLLRSPQTILVERQKK